MEPGQFAFTNKVVALLPEMGLNYTVSDRGLEVSSRFNTFTFKFEALFTHSTRTVALICWPKKSIHTLRTRRRMPFRSSCPCCRQQVRANFSGIMNNDNEMGVQTIVSSKPAGMIGYKFKNINLLGLAENFQADYAIVNNDRENSINVHVKLTKITPSSEVT